MTTSFREKIPVAVLSKGFAPYHLLSATVELVETFLVCPVTRKSTRRIPSSSINIPAFRVNKPARFGIFTATVKERTSPGGIVTGKLPVTVHVQSFVPPIRRIG